MATRGAITPAACLPPPAPGAGREGVGIPGADRVLVEVPEAMNLAGDRGGGGARAEQVGGDGPERLARADPVETGRLSDPGNELRRADRRRRSAGLRRGGELGDRWVPLGRARAQRWIAAALQ